MSRNRVSCKVSAVIKAVCATPLQQEWRTRDTKNKQCPEDSIPKRIKKHIQLQATLNNDPSPYDHVWVGDTMEQNPNKMIRFWIQNTNGLLKKNDFREFQFDIANLVDYHINYISLTETCINVNKPGLTTKINTAFTHVVPTGHISIHNTPRYPKHSYYQPGGVAACFDGLLRTKYLREGRDKYGRWIWHEFGENERITKVYTVYRVCEGSVYASGNSAAWAQQKLRLLQDGFDVNPRTHMIDSLLIDVKNHIASGQNVITMGDFNEGIHSCEQMSDKFSAAGLFNLMEATMNTTQLPRTHSRGSTAIDHVWATRYIIDNVHRSGYAPFGHLLQSDHRDLFFDILEKALFDANPLKIVYHDFRRLRSTIPKRVKKYLKHFESDWTYHKIDKKFQIIRNMFNEPVPKEKLSHMLNKLDKEITDMMIHAEKKCTMVSSHHLDHWSPELIAAVRNKRHWRTELTKAAKLPLKVGLVQAIETFRYVDGKLKQAEEEYNELSKQARKIRWEFLQDRADYLAATRNTKPEKELKRLIHVEQQRDQAGRINTIVKPFTKGGPNSILIPAVTEYPMPRIEYFDHYDINQIWTRIDMYNGEDIINRERITDRGRVEQMLLDWQRKHFEQSNETPFATDEWRVRLQDYHIQQSILDGTYQIPQDLPVEAKEILQTMRRPPNLGDDIQDFTTVENFRSYIKKIDEKTSSSPSTRHYGHYKTLLEADEKYIRVLHGILEMALQSQVILTRWKKNSHSINREENRIPVNPSVPCHPCSGR